MNRLTVIIEGVSGSGKSTLVDYLHGLLVAQGHTVHVQDKGHQTFCHDEGHPVTGIFKEKASISLETRLPDGGEK